MFIPSIFYLYSDGESPRAPRVLRGSHARPSPGVGRARSAPRPGRHRRTPLLGVRLSSGIGVGFRDHVERPLLDRDLLFLLNSCEDAAAPLPRTNCAIFPCTDRSPGGAVQLRRWGRLGLFSVRLVAIILMLVLGRRLWWRHTTGVLLRGHDNGPRNCAPRGFARQTFWARRALFYLTFLRGERCRQVDTGRRRCQGLAV